MKITFFPIFILYRLACGYQNSKYLLISIKNSKDEQPLFKHSNSQITQDNEKNNLYSKRFANASNELINKEINVASSRSLTDEYGSDYVEDGNKTLQIALAPISSTGLLQHISVYCGS